MESFFGDVWTLFEAEYNHDDIKRDMARWAFTGVFDSSHIEADVRSVIDTRIADFQGTDFEADAKKELAAAAEAEWLKLPSPFEVPAEARVIQKGGDDGERRLYRVMGKQKKKQGKAGTFLSVTKESYVKTRLTTNAVHSRATALKSAAEAAMKSAILDACRDHYHTVETEQLEGQSIAYVEFEVRGDAAAAHEAAASAAAAPMVVAPRNVTAVVDGRRDVHSYASGFFMGDAENMAFSSNLFARLEMCAARVFVSRFHYGIAQIDGADARHRLMMLTFVQLVRDVLDWFVDSYFNCLGVDEEATFRNDWKSEMAGEFFDEVLF